MFSLVTYSSRTESNITAVNISNGIFTNRFSILYSIFDLDISYNRPKFDSFTVWNSNGITITDNNTVGTLPYAIFISRNNTIYIPGRNIDGIYIWMNDSINPTKKINTNQQIQFSIFVTSSGHMYTSHDSRPYQISQWMSSETSTSATIAYGDGLCPGIFVDINSTLYCSIYYKNKVLSKPLSSSLNILTIVAGIGVAGNAANMLNDPRGLFVDDNFDLYVADFNNNRIQLFRPGQQNAITVAGNSSLNQTITLNHPIHVVLDIDKYLFIIDQYNHRIVRSGPNGFRCIIGCTGSSGSTADRLHNPTSMAFDSFGNIYVVDEENHRIQKFLRLNKTLSKHL